MDGAPDSGNSVIVTSDVSTGGDEERGQVVAAAESVAAEACEAMETDVVFTMRQSVSDQPQQPLENGSARSMTGEACEPMKTDVVFTIRNSVIDQAQQPLGNGSAHAGDVDDEHKLTDPGSSSADKIGGTNLTTQASTENKKLGGLSSLFGRLRGMPAPVKSAAAPSSTTGLIFENRPSNLPAKSAAEEKKHRKQYEAMLEAAEQKKRKEEGQQRREATDRLRREEEESSRLAFWLNDILPHWETMHTTRKAKDLWWQGLPTRVRGPVWKRALGNDLQITHDLYEISRSRAAEMLKLGIKTKENDTQSDSSESNASNATAYLVSAKSREASVQLIHLDVRRTFPHLGIFQEGGPLHKDLHDILCAYSCYRPDMGYVQGMSFLAAIFILNMEPADAFICLANLLCKPVHMALFRVDAAQISLYFNTFSVLLDETLPRLSNHFKDQGILPGMFLVDWFFTSYSKSLPLDVASRIWDVYFRDGDEFLYRTGLGILHMYQTRMLEMEFSDLAHFFTHLPDDMNVDELFQSISAISLTTKHYQQVIVQQKDKVTASC